MSARHTFLSTGAFGRMPVDQILSTCLDHGIRRLELSSGANYDAGMEPGLAATRGQLEFLVHNYFPTPSDPFVLNLASDRPLVELRSIEHCHQAIVLAADLGAPFYSVHAGFAIDPQPQDLGHDQGHLPRNDLALARARFVQNMQDVADFAAAFGLGVAVENNVVAAGNLVGGRNQSYLGVDGAEMVDLVTDIRRPNVGILLDVGHLKVSAKSLGFDADAAVQTMAPHIVALHLSDNDGARDSNQPIREDSWFWPVLAEVLTGADVSSVLEVYRLTPKEAVAQLRLADRMLERLFVAGGVA